MTLADIVAATAELPAEGEIGVVDVGTLTLESGAVLDEVVLDDD